jgi:hypothetical protein
MNQEVASTIDGAMSVNTSSATMDITLSEWKEYYPLCDFVRMVRCSPFINKPKIILETMRVEGWRIMTIDDCISKTDELKPIKDEAALLLCIQDMLKDRDFSIETAVEKTDEDGSDESHKIKIPAAALFVSPEQVLSSYRSSTATTSMPSASIAANRSPIVVHQMSNGAAVDRAPVTSSLSQQRGRAEYTRRNLALIRMELRNTVLANALDNDDNRFNRMHGLFSSPRKQHRPAQLAQVARTPLSKKVRMAQRRAASSRVASTKSVATLQGILKPIAARMYPRSASSNEKQVARRGSFNALLHDEDMTIQEPILFSPLHTSEAFQQATRWVSDENSLPMNDDDVDVDVAHSPPAAPFNSPSTSIVDRDNDFQRPSSILLSPVKQNRKCGTVLASSQYLIHMGHDFKGASGASSPLLFEEPLRKTFRDEKVNRLFPLQRNLEWDNLVDAAAVHSSSARIVSPDTTIEEMMDPREVSDATSLSMINVNGAASTTPSIAVPILTASARNPKSPPSVTTCPRGKTHKRIIDEIGLSNKSSSDSSTKKMPSTVAVTLPAVSTEKLEPKKSPPSATKVSTRPRGETLKKRIDENLNHCNDASMNEKVPDSVAASGESKISQQSSGERLGRTESEPVVAHSSPSATNNVGRFPEVDKGVPRTSKGPIRGKQLSLVAAASAKIEAASLKRKVARRREESKIVRRSKRIKAVVVKSNSVPEPLTAFSKMDILFCETYDSKTHNHPGNVRFYGYVLHFLNHFDKLHPVDRQKVASLLVGHYMLYDPTVRFLTKSTASAVNSPQCWHEMKSEESIHRTSVLIDMIREERRRETATKAQSLQRAKLHDSKKLAFLRRILTERKCPGKKREQGET